MGDEEMTRRLRVHAALAEDMSSVPDILIGLLTNTQLAPEGLIALFSLLLQIDFFLTFPDYNIPSFAPLNSFPDPIPTE